MPCLYLVDAYAQFFRAYHAIRTPMTSPVTGEPTNMTFGLIGMLLKILRADSPALTGDTAPTHLAFAMDVSGDRGTFRSQLYPAYKATRSEPPTDLAPQVDRALALLADLRVPVIGAEGFEADDIIAALSRRLTREHPDLRVRFISKDKDLKQLLVPNRVELFDVHTEQLQTVDTLREEFGIAPEQVVDMLTLMGDNVDNVPGVDGIGPKTAAQLIAEFGSLEAVLAEARNESTPEQRRKIKGKRRENILAAADRLPLSRQLVTLRDDAPADFSLDAADVRRFNLPALLPILKELGFNRYQSDVRALLGAPDADTDGPPAAARAAADTDWFMASAAAARDSAASQPAAPAPAKPRTKPAALDDADSLFAASPNAAPPRAASDGSYHCVQTLDDLHAMLRVLQAAPLIAVDTETTGTRPMQADLVGLSFAAHPGEAWYVPLRSPHPETHLTPDAALPVLKPILEDPATPKTGHNLKFDALILRRNNIILRGHAEPTPPATSQPPPTDALGGDTMVASYLIDASRSSHSMDALALALLNRENIPISDLIGTGKSQRTFDQVPLDRATEYAAEDADVSLRLAHAMHPQLRAMGLESLYRDIELPLVNVLAELEWNGILVDPAELDRQRLRLESEITALQAKIDAAARDTLGYTFDINSPKQLAAALFNKDADTPNGLGIKPVKRTKTGFSTDAEVLEKLAEDAAIESPIPRLILEYRQLAKLVSTYLVALKEEINPRTGRIHASFNQTIAATGRLSSSDPNLQNIPIRTDVGREIRRAFIAPPGRTLITADYSQIELRILAHLSEDPALIAAFERGEDIHAAVAAQIHGVPLADVTKAQRNGAKMVNFGIVYGITPFGLARRLGCSNSEAEEIITGYKKRFASITTFLSECVAHAQRHGYVETMLKRRRPIPDIDSNQPNRRALAERIAINSVVQGSAADLIKLAMIDLHHRIQSAPGGTGLQSVPSPPVAEHLTTPRHSPSLPLNPLHNVLMLLQIHDELVFESPVDQAEAARVIIVDRMQRALPLRVPVLVDSTIAPNWFDGK